ncbi:MAG: ATP-binding protein [Verrucomicrobia bacterium]|nr:ATP-binding protein [Verrucomicrobiota bacterium]
MTHVRKKSRKTDSLGKIVGRVREQKVLKDRIESNRAEFITIYGRRRIGNTYLVKNFINKVPCVFFHVTGIQKGSLEEQLEEFSKSSETLSFTQGHLFVNVLVGEMLLKI